MDIMEKECKSKRICFFLSSDAALSSYSYVYLGLRVKCRRIAKHAN